MSHRLQNWLGGETYESSRVLSFLNPGPPLVATNRLTARYLIVLGSWQSRLVPGLWKLELRLRLQVMLGPPGPRGLKDEVGLGTERSLYAEGGNLCSTKYDS